MAGILPFNAQKGNLNVGYREIKSIENSLILSKGKKLIGHEFHRWNLEIIKTKPYIKINTLTSPWEIKGWGKDSTKEGWSNNFLHASWIHLHWASSPHIIKSWEKAIRKNNSR